MWAEFHRCQVNTRSASVNCSLFVVEPEKKLRAVQTEAAKYEFSSSSVVLSRCMPEGGNEQLRLSQMPLPLNDIVFWWF